MIINKNTSLEQTGIWGRLAQVVSYNHENQQVALRHSCKCSYLFLLAEVIHWQNEHFQCPLCHSVFDVVLLQNSPLEGQHLENFSLTT